MKIINLKKFLTLAEAAKYLSTTCGEEVSEADVLGLVLDRRFALSVNFINPVYVRWGEVVARNFEDSKNNKINFKEWKNKARVDSTHDLQLENKASRVIGIFDLFKHLEGELRIRKLQREFLGGPQLKRRNGGSVLIQSRDGMVAELQASFDDDPNIIGSRASHQKIEHEIVSKGIDDCFAKYLMKASREARQPFRDKYADMDMFYSASELPTDCVLGVRTEAIKNFELSLNQNPVTKDRPLIKSERDSLLVIIAAICKEAKLDYKKHAKTARLILSITAEMGVQIGESTIEGHLKKIPETLEGRMK